MLQSFIFRIILIAFSILITIKYENAMPDIFCYMLMPVYAVIYYFLKKYEKPVLRLVWDFCFLNVIIYGCDIHEPTVFFFVLLPMINAVNYTGKKSNSWILLLLTVATFFIQTWEFEQWLILPIISLSVLCAVSMVRYRNWTIERNITNKVDAYFLSQEKLKSHEIYKSIIDELNKFFMLSPDEGISRIMVYTLKGNTMWLVNASSFMWERTTLLSDEQSNELRKRNFLNINKESCVTHLYYVKKEEIEYVFVCDLAKNSPIYLELFRFNKVMFMTFAKLSMLLNTEYRIMQRREEKFNEIKDSVLFVNQAIRVMHFIRNKMTPVSNLLAYLKIEDKIPEEKKLIMKNKLGKVVSQADIDFKDMLKYADYLLDKSNNPFGETEIREIPVSKIFILLSEIAQSQLNIVVDANNNIQVTDSAKERVIHFNTMNCKIMLTDWIANMRKNSGDYNKITMKYEDNDILNVHFENTYITSDDEIQCLVRDMNNKNKDAVLEGKNYGYGIYFIKQLARDYGIGLYSSHVIDEKRGSLLTLDFKFTTYERKQENSDI